MDEIIVTNKHNTSVVHDISFPCSNTLLSANRIIYHNSVPYKFQTIHVLKTLESIKNQKNKIQFSNFI